VFADPDAPDGPDLKHSAEENRFMRLGHSMPYTMKGTADGEKVRIISARRASRKEKAAYASGSRD
jgi:uncharacterized DUF497 family protein